VVPQFGVHYRDQANVLLPRGKVTSEFAVGYLCQTWKRVPIVGRLNPKFGHGEIQFGVTCVSPAAGGVSFATM